MPRAVEPTSAIAAERAEHLIAKERPGELAKEAEALVDGGSGTRLSDLVAKGKVAEDVLGKSADKEAQPTGTADLPSGSFSISDWTGYPALVPKPEGPFRLLESTEYNAARNAADKANRTIRRQQGLVRQSVDVHEINPVKFGGSPIDTSNKIVLPREVHRQQATPWWNQLLKDLGG